MSKKEWWDNNTPKALGSVKCPQCKQWIGYDNDNLEEMECSLCHTRFMHQDQKDKSVHNRQNYTYSNPE